MAVNLAPPDPARLFPVAGVELGIAMAGVKKPGRKDLLVMRLAPGACVAGVFTRNRFCAAPVLLAASGAGWTMFDITGRTMLQRLIPDEKLTRTLAQHLNAQIAAGAQAVQVGTAAFVNPRVCPEIVAGLERFCATRGVAIRELIGAAHRAGEPAEAPVWTG